MKTLNKMRVFALLIAVFVVAKFASAQDDNKPQLMTNLKYISTNNNFQYLKVKTQVKADNKLQPAGDISLALYLDTASAENLIGKVKTDEKGEAKTIIPANLKDKWSSETTHKFIAVSGATKTLEETTTELEIAKARITLDATTEDSTRKVAVKVESYSNGTWTPEKGVDLKIGVRRLGGDLKIGDEESYTTDSLGQASAEFKLNALPGDIKGNLTLVAKVEDNDKFGSLSIEKSVPWGVYVTHVNNFDKRSLFARQGRAPVWLDGMAFTIIALVWGVIVFLIFQIIKISKLGKGTVIEEKEEVPSEELVAQV